MQTLSKTEAIPQQAADAARLLDGQPAEWILTWASLFVPRMAVTSSFGADSIVLLHLVSKIDSSLPVLFLDTGYHFAETLEYRRFVARDLGLTIQDVLPPLTVAEQDARVGKDLFATDPDACCRLRKKQPLEHALRSFQGWVTGIRREQTPERAAAPIVDSQWQDDRWVLKVAPLANWSQADVDAYIARHGLPRHPLVARGYPSIGCEPCTKKAAPGVTARSGRWAAFENKTECSLHVP